MTIDRVPVSLVTGFLGSGKTTLIAALLRQPAMAGTAVIVNEFGAVGIDDAIFAEALGSDDVMLLANGCLCCVARDDLAATVWRLCRRPQPPRRIVVETSGLADPAAALRGLMADPRLRQAIRLDALVATIDAVNGRRDLARQALAQRQCAVADRRIITKVDLAEPAEVAALADRLRAINPGAAVAYASHGAIDADILFGASLFNAQSGRADGDRWLAADALRRLPLHEGKEPGSIRFSGGAAHGPSVGTWLVEETRPVDWPRLSSQLGGIVARFGDSLLRLKGLVHTAGDPRPLVIHGVQRVFHSPVRLTGWSRSPATSIVVIGDEGARPAVAAIAAALAEVTVGDTVVPAYVGAAHEPA